MDRYNRHNKHHMIANNNMAVLVLSQVRTKNRIDPFSNVYQLASPVKHLLLGCTSTFALINCPKGEKTTGKCLKIFQTAAVDHCTSVRTAKIEIIPMNLTENTYNNHPDMHFESPFQ